MNEEQREVQSGPLLTDAERQERYEVESGAVIVVIVLVSIVSAAIGCGVAWIVMRVWG